MADGGGGGAGRGHAADDQRPRGRLQPRGARRLGAGARARAHPQLTLSLSSEARCELSREQLGAQCGVSSAWWHGCVRRLDLLTLLCPGFATTTAGFPLIT